MDLILLILSFLIMIIGIVGSVIPVLPGPLSSWVGLFMFTNISTRLDRPTSGVVIFAKTSKSLPALSSFRIFFA